MKTFISVGELCGEVYAGFVVAKDIDEALEILKDRFGDDFVPSDTRELSKEKVLINDLTVADLLRLIK